MLKREFEYPSISFFNSSSRVIYIDKQLKNMAIGAIEYVSNVSFNFLKFKKYVCWAVTMETELQSQPIVHHSSVWLSVTIEALLQSQLTIYFATYYDFNP